MGALLRLRASLGGLRAAAAEEHLAAAAPGKLLQSLPGELEIVPVWCFPEGLRSLRSWPRLLCCETSGGAIISAILPAVLSHLGQRLRRGSTGQEVPQGLPPSASAGYT